MTVFPPTADAIDALLPQTQCTQCGYPGCRPYAEAIAAGAAAINRCPPGGAAGIAKLAALTAQPVLPLDAQCGVEAPLTVAVIDESLCIGCTLCIRACPVDAIVGASKRMHSVIASWCTGCELCIAPCPMDCIAMQDAGRDWTADDAKLARARFEARQLRLARDKAEHDARLSAPALAVTTASPSLGADPGTVHKQSVIQAAIARARARRQNPPQ
ncbi:MAG: electron transport complex subunit RsxB [Burkholderiaceae bacterium]